MPDAVDTVICAPDDGWRYHPKYVERFADIKTTVYSCMLLDNYWHITHKSHRTLQKMYHVLGTKHNCTSAFYFLEYIGYSSQASDGRLYPAHATARSTVNSPVTVYT